MKILLHKFKWWILYYCLFLTFGICIQIFIDTNWSTNMATGLTVPDVSIIDDVESKKILIGSNEINHILLTLFLMVISFIIIDFFRKRTLKKTIQEAVIFYVIVSAVFLLLNPLLTEYKTTSNRWKEEARIGDLKDKYKVSISSKNIGSYYKFKGFNDIDINEKYLKSFFFYENPLYWVTRPFEEKIVELRIFGPNLKMEQYNKIINLFEKDNNNVTKLTTNCVSDSSSYSLTNIPFELTINPKPSQTSTQSYKDECEVLLDGKGNSTGVVLTRNPSFAYKVERNNATQELGKHALNLGFAEEESILVTKEDFDKLQSGMTYEEVVKNIGFEGFISKVKTIVNETGKTITTTYPGVFIFNNTFGGWGEITFIDGLLIQKTWIDYPDEKNAKNRWMEYGEKYTQKTEKDYSSPQIIEKTPVVSQPPKPTPVPEPPEPPIDVQIEYEEINMYEDIPALDRHISTAQVYENEVRMNMGTTAADGSAKWYDTIGYYGFTRLYDTQSGKLVYKGFTGRGYSYEGKGIVFNDKMQIIYRGNFLNGTKEGYGEEYYDGKAEKIDGSVKYKGQFANNQYNGLGIIYNEQGKAMHKGIFKDGKFVKGEEFDLESLKIPAPIKNTLAGIDVKDTKGKEVLSDFRAFSQPLSNYLLKSKGITMSFGDFNDVTRYRATLISTGANYRDDYTGTIDIKDPWGGKYKVFLSDTYNYITISAQDPVTKNTYSMSVYYVYGNNETCTVGFDKNSEVVNYPYQKTDSGCGSPLLI